MKKSSLILFLILIVQIELCAQPEFINYTNKDNVHDIAFYNYTVWQATTGGVVKRAINTFSIQYIIPYYSSVKIEVLTDKVMQEGVYIDKWDVKKYGSGVYYLKLAIKDQNLIKEVVVLK